MGPSWMSFFLFLEFSPQLIIFNVMMFILYFRFLCGHSLNLWGCSHLGLHCYNPLGTPMSVICDSCYCSWPMPLVHEVAVSPRAVIRVTSCHLLLFPSSFSCYGVHSFGGSVESCLILSPSKDSVWGSWSPQVYGCL